MIRVLLVDDHAALREPLAFMFERDPAFTVVAHAGSLEEAREVLAGVDLAVLDLDLPDGLGTDLIDELLESSPQAQILVLTGLSEKAQLATAIEAGAAGVLRKSARTTEIIEAARKLCAGGQLLSAQEVLEAVRLAARKRREDYEVRRKLSRLTSREKEVLEVLAEGLSDKEIALRLHIGRGTVRTHIESILSKLESASRLQALVFAARHGAIEIS